MVFDLPPRVEDDPRADERKLFASIVTPGVTISGCRLAIYASGRGQQGWCPQSFSFRCCSKSGSCRGNRVRPESDAVASVCVFFQVFDEFRVVFNIMNVRVRF